MPLPTESVGRVTDPAGIDMRTTLGRISFLRAPGAFCFPWPKGDKAYESYLS